MVTPNIILRNQTKTKDDVKPYIQRLSWLTVKLSQITASQETMNNYENFIHEKKNNNSNNNKTNICVGRLGTYLKKATLFMIMISSQTMCHVFNPSLTPTSMSQQCSSSLYPGQRWLQVNNPNASATCRTNRQFVKGSKIELELSDQQMHDQITVVSCNGNTRILILKHDN